MSVCLMSTDYWRDEMLTPEERASLFEGKEVISVSATMAPQPDGSQLGSANPTPYRHEDDDPPPTCCAC